MTENGTQPPGGHYEVEDHPTIKGLAVVRWVVPGQRQGTGPELTFGQHALSPLCDAIRRYLLDKARAGQAPAEPADEAPPPDALAVRRSQLQRGRHYS